MKREPGALLPMRNLRTKTGCVAWIKAAAAGCLFALASLAPVAPAQALIEIDITQGTVEPLPIALPDFAPEGADAQLARELTAVIANDLRRSGLFKPLDPASFIEKGITANSSPRFGDWRTIGAQALVAGSLARQADGRLRAEFRLWDVFAGEQMLGQQFFTTQENWRRLAHIIADAIYERLTGEKGYFDTRIVFVDENGPKNKRVKRLAIMDQDGENHKFLTDGSDIVLTPRFSPTLRDVTYMSYYRGIPRVYLLDLDTGRREVVGDFNGMTFAPRFTPDGARLVMSMAVDGNTEIYEMDLRTRSKRRLTDHPAIDTSPSYAPDGSRIVFNSDRGGTQQLYVMNSDGSGVQRISFGDGRYATPVWSPRGDLIAFTRMKGGEFYVGVMRPDGSGERMLSQGFLVEGPTWAPNGRVLMYFRQNGGSDSPKLFSIDLTGYNERQVVTPLDASDPAWSPLIP